MWQGICSIPGCGAPWHCQEWCKKHYERWRKHGDPNVVKRRGYQPRPPAERFWPKVDRRSPDECWPWLGAKGAGGYGRFYLKGKVVPAHEFAYELLVGPVPDGMEMDHVQERGCTDHGCCNPAHLEPVTHRENILRGTAPPALHAAKTHCPKGHPYSGPNLRIDTNGGRRCRACESVHNRNRKPRR